MSGEENGRSFVVKAEVKRVIKELDHQTAGDFTEALSQRVETLVRAAAKRAADNGRKQVRSYDL